jgi:ketosteroid isomerase-like protein
VNGREKEDEMMATTDRDFFDAYLDAWNAHDPAAVARYMADDAIYEDVALGRVLHGRSEIAKFVEEATRASVGKLDTSGRILENRDYYNLAEMLAQLGIEPAAPPQRA